MLLHNIQENDNNFINMEFHTTFKKQIIIVWKNNGPRFFKTKGRKMCYQISALDSKKSKKLFDHYKPLSKQMYEKKIIQSYTLV